MVLFASQRGSRDCHPSLRTEAFVGARDLVEGHIIKPGPRALDHCQAIRKYDLAVRRADGLSPLWSSSKHKVSTGAVVRWDV